MVSKKKVQSSIGALQDKSGQLVVDADKKAELFNEFFASVFLNTDGDNPPTLNTDRCSEGTRPPKVSADLVKEYLEGLDGYKSAGPDDLHPWVLKELARVIAEPLARLFEHSWCSGQIPENWKRANVLPIFMKGRRDEPGNFRTVGLTSTLGKYWKKSSKNTFVKAQQGT